MADNIAITPGTGASVSTEEVTTLNGATVSAQHLQRIIASLRTADGTAVDGVGLAHRLDPVNDGLTTYPYGHSYTYISTATTTTVKSGAGVLQSIIVNGGTTGTIIGYDNTAGSGPIIFSFDTTNALAPFMFNIAFTTGLTIVTSAATKITVTYR